MLRVCGCPAAPRLEMTGGLGPRRGTPRDMARTLAAPVPTARLLTMAPLDSTVVARPHWVPRAQAPCLAAATRIRPPAAAHQQGACAPPSPLHHAARVAACARTETHNGVMIVASVHRGGSSATETRHHSTSQSPVKALLQHAQSQYPD